MGNRGAYLNDNEERASEKEGFKKDQGEEIIGRVPRDLGGQKGTRAHQGPLFLLPAQ